MKFFNKIWFILDSQDRSKFFILVILLLVASFLEVLGISLIIPVISLFTENNKNFDFIKILNSKFDDQNNLLLFICSFFFILYLVKSLLLTIIYRYQTNFLFKFQAKTTTKIFYNYIFGSHQSLIKRKTSEIIRNLTLETDQLIYSVLQPLLNFIIEFIFFISIILVLFIVQVKNTFIISVILTVIFFIYFLYTRNFLSKIGNQRQANENDKIKTLQESIGGIRDLITLNLREQFISRFKNFTFKTSQSKSDIEFINYMPKIWIELLAIFMIFLLVFFLKLDKYFFSNILPVLVLYAFAAFRLIPITNRLIISYNHIKYSAVVLEAIFEEFLKSKKNKEFKIIDVELNFSIRKIELKNITFYYNKDEPIPALRNLSIDFKKGDRIGITGESGKGKSTLLDLISGFLKPLEGKIIINENNKLESLINYKNILGYVSQKAFFYDTNIVENISLTESEYNYEKLNEVIQVCLLKELIDDKKNSNIGENGINLSGGQKQKIAIARSLYKNPKVLILDEATNSLSNDAESKILENIFKMSSLNIIFIISHQKSSLVNCNKILEFNNNKKIVIK
jgi:ABC-type bacteriocin/lantibiotic exporter with double-glycine peptidase domain